jgi:hypothetical protein
MLLHETGQNFTVCLLQFHHRTAFCLLGSADTGFRPGAEPDKKDKKTPAD